MSDEGFGTRFGRSHESADRAEIESELLGPDPELRAEITDGLFQSHQRETNRFGLVIGQGANFHSADGLSLEELPDEFDERQHEFQDGPANFVRIGIPPGRAARRAETLDLGAKGFDLA
jgi:hypothetical protein